MAFTDKEVVSSICSVEQLDLMLSEPTEEVVETMKKNTGDFIVLGGAGKIGPSLVRMIKRASDMAGTKRHVYVVDRPGLNGQEAALQAVGLETIGCDMLDPSQMAALPDAQNVIFMIGMKFGSTGMEALTWALNAFLPGEVCRKFNKSKIVAYSSGNIYGLVPLSSGGSVESDAPNPIGDYATSAMGRERIFEYFSQALGIPTTIFRLNYAVEMRYGVLVDVAQQVWAGQPVDVTMGNANVIWQGDVNAATIRAFDVASSPATFLNVAGPELLSIRRVAKQYGEMMGKEVTITGTEAPDVLFNNAQYSHRIFGYPNVSVQQMMIWIADWVSRGGASLGKPTHFEVRDGKF